MPQTFWSYSDSSLNTENFDTIWKNKQTKTNNNNNKTFGQYFCIKQKTKQRNCHLGQVSSVAPTFCTRPPSRTCKERATSKFADVRLCIGTSPRFGGRSFHLLISRQNEMCWMSHVMGAATSEKKYKLKAENLKNAPLLVPFLEQQTNLCAVY